MLTAILFNVKLIWSHLYCESNYKNTFVFNFSNFILDMLVERWQFRIFRTIQLSTKVTKKLTLETNYIILVPLNDPIFVEMEIQRLDFMEF